MCVCVRQRKRKGEKSKVNLAAKSDCTTHTHRLKVFSSFLQFIIDYWCCCWHTFPFSSFLFLLPLSATETHTVTTAYTFSHSLAEVVLALPYLVCCTLWKQQQQSKLLRLFFSKDVTLNWLERKKKRGKADKKCVCVCVWKRVVTVLCSKWKWKCRGFSFFFAAPMREKLWCHRIIGQVSVHSRHARARESTAKEGSLAACFKHCSREDTASVSFRLAGTWLKFNLPTATAAALVYGQIKIDSFPICLPSPSPSLPFHSIPQQTN